MGKKIGLVIVALLIVAGIGAGIYFGTQKGTAVSGETINANSGEAETANLNTQERYNAFCKVLKDYYYNRSWPDGTTVDRLDISTSEEYLDTYSIFDVDDDKKDELIIVHSDTSMAGMYMMIYDYDDAKGELVEEFMGSVFSTFYKNGIIKSDVSHNQGRAYGFMWPYGLNKYDVDKDTYVELVWIDGWDKQFDEDFEMYLESGEKFPDEIDKDGNGGVYLIAEPDKDGRYVDDAEYEEWIKENVGELEELNIPFVTFTGAHISETIKKYNADVDTILFEEYYDEAEKIISEMTIEERIAQMMLVMYPGDKKALEQIEACNPGGYILFRNDVQNETSDSLKEKIQKLQDASKVKMMIAVDEEGGPVVRVSAYTQYREEPFDSMRNIYDASGMDAVIADSKEKNEFLQSYGINMNLTPVVDLPTNNESYMYKRAISNDEPIASEFAEKVIERMNEDKMLSSMKHFPGYGDNVDTHTGIAIDERTKEDFVERDFKPFIAGIKAGAPTIMVNHNILKNIDDKYPASISKEVHDILRDELNYSGLIITDALNMDAIKKYVENGEAGAQAVISGNDMIITNSLEAHIKEIINAMNEGRVDLEQINVAARRVVACKLAYGIE
ncbi:MAG: glycoside hydrolase family 3 protein [Clostridia bacterium]|nr:glycoside hydrolase family 3 protein [Clostridia bacterium]